MGPHSKYARILLKMSGEALSGEQGHGIDQTTIDGFAREITQVTQTGVQVAIVIGGGNIHRGTSPGIAGGMDRTTSDHMGMLATVINSLAMQDALERQGMFTRVDDGH